MVLTYYGFYWMNVIWMWIYKTTIPKFNGLDWIKRPPDIPKSVGPLPDGGVFTRQPVSVQVDFNTHAWGEGPPSRSSTTASPSCLNDATGLLSPPIRRSACCTRRQMPWPTSPTTRRRIHGHGYTGITASRARTAGLAAAACG